MATVGLIMVIGISGTQKSSTNIIGIGFGLAVAIFYATVVILNKFIKNVTGLEIEPLYNFLLQLLF